MIVRLSLFAALLVTTAPLAAQGVPIVLPGAPGAEPRVINAKQAIALSDTRFSPADVSFMQGMIVHHQQAVDMAQLVKQRTNNEAVLKTADRIEAGQKDEMDFMRAWLADRNLVSTSRSTAARPGGGCIAACPAAIWARSGWQSLRQTRASYTRQ